MIRRIVTDPVFLARKSEPASEADMGTAADLEDTLRANLDCCVGMAANMIGAHRRIIVFFAGTVPVVMFNPRVVCGTGRYETEESCLSLGGSRKALRWHKITVAYMDRWFRPREGTFEGYTAQIIQHEIDHCDGILI
ncbi:MAG: peptide deformylase [Clostridiales bacterium]|nr:peptide deformylase [Clostridiales bacterium]